MGDALTEVLDRFAGDADVRVVVVTGGAPALARMRSYEGANITSPSRSIVVEARSVSHD
jgi:hypothetical protein